MKFTAGVAGFFAMKASMAGETAISASLGTEMMRLLNMVRSIVPPRRREMRRGRGHVVTSMELAWSCFHNSWRSDLDSVVDRASSVFERAMFVSEGSDRMW